MVWFLGVGLLCMVLDLDLSALLTFGIWVAWCSLILDLCCVFAARFWFNLVVLCGFVC